MRPLRSDLCHRASGTGFDGAGLANAACDSDVGDENPRYGRCTQLAGV